MSELPTVVLQLWYRWLGRLLSQCPMDHNLGTNERIPDKCDQKLNSSPSILSPSAITILLQEARARQRAQAWGAATEKKDRRDGN